MDGGFVFFFFFQAEDGIRDKLVTGVQTCALPIWLVLGIILLILAFVVGGGSGWIIGLIGLAGIVTGTVSY